MGDEGLFGPRTVTWHLHADPAMWIAGVCSLYLQALHPRAVAAVVQNSRFQDDPLGRLMRTGNFVGTTVYGTTAEAEKAAERVRAVHRKLRGTDRQTGAEIRLDEPELLLWVHCAEVSSFAGVVRRAGFPLTAAQLDRYFDEQRRSAALVGLDPAAVPGSSREMAAYFARMRPQLRRTEDSDLIYRFLHRPFAPWWLLPVNLGYLPLGHLAYSVLPDWARRIHGRPAYSPPAIALGLRSFRAAMLAVPDELRFRYPGGHVQRAVDRLGREALPNPAALTGR
ncbi:oxygenase MpaB family protein [Saccharopolyspora sp. WRP15-2]|uniref:Oxygenase MpaB family protein n=1 Tax=Saccharopolyspora oryzae TaxID=2997343 RepID=A0ABT4UY92_9PSEU|nr:oxygenase MpaB family protein [Saccharopolyspora oryzae]MDA3626523.1 oxygenase MpaB family protein [Saccharopolyspora oryzae]